MAAREVDEITVDVFRVRWTKIISNRLDTTALKAARKDIYDAFVRQTETRRFLIA
jgi:predicted phage-related endonuclease